MATDEEKRAAIMRDGDADLIFLFEEAEVSMQMQYGLIVAGFKNPRKYYHVADSVAAARTAFTAILNIDPGTPANRLALASLLEVWDSSKKVSEKQLELRAEIKSAGTTRILPHSERTAMRRVVETQYQKISQDEVPSNTYLSEKCQEVEENEPMASRLDEILSVEDVDLHSLTTGLDSAGHIIITKRKGKASLPSTTEEFRTRLRLEANTWMFLATKFTNRPWLRDQTPNGWNDYAEFFLGKKCLLLPACQPSWMTVLEYEFQCRKEAFRKVRDENVTLVFALSFVVKCSELRDLYLLMPMTLSNKKPSVHPGDKRPREEDGPAPVITQPWTKREQKGKGKGKGNKQKGKGKGKGDASLRPRGEPSRMGWIRQTPDGRNICYKYFDAVPCDGSCGMVHICRVAGCGIPHNKIQHYQAGQGPA
jgi:hypothetical protein